MAAKQKDLLKCRTKNEVYVFAAKHGITVSGSGDNIMVGGWNCVFKGDKFLYVK